MAQKTRSQLYTEINNQITDALNQQVSSAIIRGILTDIVDSAPNITDGATASTIFGSPGSINAGQGTIILSSPNSYIPAGVTNSAIIGGEGITLTQSGVVFIGGEILPTSVTGPTGPAGASNDLEQTLAIGNDSGTYSIILGTATVIKAAIGRGQLDLSVGGPNSVALTNDNGVFGDAYLYMDSTFGGFSNNGIMAIVGSNSVSISSGGTTSILNSGSITPIAEFGFADININRDISLDSASIIKSQNGLGGRMAVDLFSTASFALSVGTLIGTNPYIYTNVDGMNMNHPKDIALTTNTCGFTMDTTNDTVSIYSADAIELFAPTTPINDYGRTYSIGKITNNVSGVADYKQLCGTTFSNAAIYTTNLHATTTTTQSGQKILDAAYFQVGTNYVKTVVMAHKTNYSRAYSLSYESLFVYTGSTISQIGTPTIIENTNTSGVSATLSIAITGCEIVVDGGSTDEFTWASNTEIFYNKR